MYIIDSSKNAIIIRLSSEDNPQIYLNWINECTQDVKLKLSNSNDNYNTLHAEDVLNYFNFSLDEFIEALFAILPAKSAESESNKALIKILLIEPKFTKSKCCLLADKSPTHFTRLSQTIRENANKASKLTGGRNAIRIIESIRVDF